MHGILMQCILEHAGRTVPKLGRNDREVDHGEKAEEVEDEVEEDEAGRSGAQEEEGSEECGPSAGCEEGQEAVGAAQGEARGCRTGTGPGRAGADARDGRAVARYRYQRLTRDRSVA